MTPTFPLKTIMTYYDGFRSDAQVCSLGGKSNVSFRVRTADHDAAFKFYHKKHHRHADIMEEIRFVDFAYAHQLPVCRYISGKNGEIIQATDDYFIVGSKYLNGEPLSDLSIDCKRIASVCTLFEDFLRVSQAYDRIPDQADSLEMRLKTMYHRLYHTALDSRFQALTAFFTRRTEATISRFRSPHGKRFVHMDLSPNNVMIAAKDQKAYLFDFENWIFDSEIVDLASIILEFAVEKDGCLYDHIRMFVGAYMRTDPASYDTEELVCALKCLCALYYAYIAIENGDYEFSLLYYLKYKIVSSRQFFCRLKEIAAEFWNEERTTL